MAITVTPLTKALGAKVHGIDIAAGVNDTDFAELIRLFNDYSVLVFHHQDITDEEQIRFSRGFGELETTVVTNAGAGSYIANISNVDAETNEIIPPVDKRMVFNSGNEMWHTDSSFKRVPATASLLSGREVPPEGDKASLPVCEQRTPTCRQSGNSSLKSSWPFTISPIHAG